MFVEDEEIETTPTHPFWVIGKGWVAAGDMEVGDKVYLYSGEGREIKELKFEYLDSPIKVYNFEVEDWHTYFVSEHDVFVHNSCGDNTYDPDQGALDQLGKELETDFKRTGNVISRDEALIIDSWAKEYNVPQHHGVLDGSGSHWSVGLDHTHIRGRHIPYGN